MSRTQYSRAEHIADVIVHVIGIACSLVANGALATITFLRAEFIHVAGLGVYGFGLLTMFVCSALNNLMPEGRLTAMFQRLDHASIFLLIAATYTPFALFMIGGTFGVRLLTFVWVVASVGIVLKLISPTGWRGLAITAYLLLGWVGVVALDVLIATVSLSGVFLLFLGGLLYSFGVVFHLWHRLPYHRAIWHFFVLAAASCHFTAILTDVALATQK